MNFASLPYLFFLITCVVIYYGIHKNYRNVFLLFASYFFYSLFGFGFTALMFITTLITYYSSYYCYHAENLSKRKLFMGIGLSLDLLIFVLFKYVHIIDIDLMNWPNWSAQKLLIPIGISFYTFKTIGYCIDIYKKKYAPENSFAYYALSVSFFPQLIAGPIEKSHIISIQLKQNDEFDIKNFIEGSKLILWGLFKKIVIADSIAQIINPVFGNITEYKGLDFVVALIGFTYQIYVDFSGYSDIAIGSAKCFGVNLPANFNKPFFSKNYREFWTRWHATFSKWLKEYVFDTLGGISKTSKSKTVFNIFILFLIVGLWHGATINYIIYAQLAFVFMLLDIITKDIRKKIFPKRKSTLNKIINYVSIVSLIVVLSIFFRPSSFQDSVYILKHICSLHFYHLSSPNILYIIMYILVFEFFQYFQISAEGHCFQGVRNFYLKLAMFLFILFSILLLNSRPEVAFQYFQF